ncbi:U-box domain-containing protein 15 [Euphorbia peplus]|nr:U-box domain-containing protein 15 [Euphorbia peplus]
MEIHMDRERKCTAVSSSSNGGDYIDFIKEMMKLIETVGSYSSYRKIQRKECLNLVRRLKLLLPLLEELKEVEKFGDFDCLINLNKALLSAKKLLKKCNYGSKLYLALESEAVMIRFHVVYDKLNQALGEIPYDEFGISVEVKEQVELMHMQLQRAKRRSDTQDIELAMDTMVVFSRKDDRDVDTAILERLAYKLELHTIADLKAETIAVKKLIKSRDVQNAESIQQIKDLLEKLKQISGVDETIKLDGPISSKCLRRCQSLLIPHEFLCPITLEIMVDPVIVATGQTYERQSITKWLNSNHRTCPKTGQTLDHLSLAPNFALRNLISQWCEKNNFELPKKHASSVSDSSSSTLKDEVLTLVQNLSSSDFCERRDAIVKIRMLSKENPENRILIANSGAIPPLVQLLACHDPMTQEQAVTALLNLSIDESNKRSIAREGAIPPIIDILQTGTEEARENSAAALFSLSMLDENKALVGTLNGIPPLVNLLQNGTIRGKKDAATALFNLSLNQTNKFRAIKAGIITPLLHLLEDKDVSMVDEALSILLLLASHSEGRSEIGKLSFIRTLVEIIKNGSPKNKECATSVLLVLGVNNSSFILAALQYGVYEALIEIVRCGTNRAQRKANSLLQQMSKCEHIP